MELLLIIVLILTLISLALIKKHEETKASRFRHYTSDKDYLDTVKEATKKRFEEEQNQQEYKNNIKKDYLD